MTDDMYLRIKQVTAITGLSRATIYSMMASGTFPMKTALGVRAVGWLSSEIQTWIVGRKLVEKRGREARPAGRKVVTRQHVPASIPSIVAKPAPKFDAAPEKQGFHSGQPDADWVSMPDGPSSTSDRLRLINAMKRQSGTPVRRKTQPISVFAHLKKPHSVEMSHDGAKPAPAKARSKAKK